jgi:hypothetical protein
VDYCAYLLSKISSSNGVVSLLSNDQNCCLKAELQGLYFHSRLSQPTEDILGIVTISPKPRTSVEALLPSMMQKTARAQPLSESAQNHTVAKSAHQTSFSDPAQTFVEASMDLDDDLMFTPPSDAHPLSILHREFIEHLSQLLPHLAYEAALQEQARREKTEGRTQEKVAPKKSALYASIHAPRTAAIDGRAFIMPKVEEVQSWTPLDCIHFALEFPPTKEGGKSTYLKTRAPNIGRLKLFLLPYDRPGGRKGKDWSMGDWRVALEELEHVASYCDWQNVQDCVTICRRQLAERCPA